MSYNVTKKCLSSPGPFVMLQSASVANDVSISKSPQSEVYPDAWLTVNYQHHNSMFCQLDNMEVTEELLANIINSTSSYLLKLDFDAIAAQQQAAQLIQEENNQDKVIEILSSASRNM